MKTEYFRLVIAVATLVLGCGLIIKGIDEYNLDKEFKTNGIKTEAKLTGYQYWETKRYRQKGDRPVFSYISSSGDIHQYIAYEYGATSEFNKETLASKKVIITYLRRNEKIARIDEWYGYKQYVGLIFGTVFSLLGIGLFTQAIKHKLFKKSKLLSPAKDPIEEAEVYISYGRKSQAIEILEKARLTHPNRNDIRKKLDELLIKP